ncbi:MAG: hypothetical protein AMK70_03975 [Nitrospira bacterium SG8_35_1]|nr:MAG: hypothetical protein AMK70_03975 [Nitrospira bacterium SG8_35_1]
MEEATKKKILIVSSVIYIFLSIVLYNATLTPQLHSFFQSIWSVIWLFGPPANLIYKNDFILPYIIGSLFWFSCMATAWKSTTPQKTMFFHALSVVIWLAFGILVYSPVI